MLLEYFELCYAYRISHDLSSTQRQRFAGNRLESKKQLDARMVMTGIECRRIHWSCSWREQVSSVQRREDWFQSFDMRCWMQVDLGLDALFGKFECVYGSDWYNHM